MRGTSWLRILGVLLLVSAASLTVDDPSPARATSDSVANGEPEVGNSDLDDYVSAYGVSPLEAREQWAATDAAGVLQAQLVKTEAGVFGGLWIQREPTFAIVVGVLPGGEKAIQQHIDHIGLAEIARIQLVERTLADLRADQDAVSALVPPGIDYAAGVDQSEGRVKVLVETAGDAAVLAGLGLPQSVAVFSATAP